MYGAIPFRARGVAGGGVVVALESKTNGGVYGGVYVRVYGGVYGLYGEVYW